MLKKHGIEDYDIRWDVMEDYYDQLVDVVKEESGGFQTFVAGTVPASAFSRPVRSARVIGFHTYSRRSDARCLARS